ncbi:hypothetical protein K431DRAFT_222511 [Polychaeton citri CBS 116435]|uniref:POPLD-domain-containing protein n=1 Tax=Polychaeton citri CBS 116435 TaxID=1314669 RepID=A0A9P4UPW1_9PEZI|nr:hypothetical protein K431DRAFT_222511 [Polychaeton citri CBS 116435]
MRDARTISTQASSKALKNGELDVEKFVKAREYEVHALEKGLRDSKKVLTKRAFQQVPKELRRRTASHNVKRVPKRLQNRAKREMKDDNTPTMKNQKPSRHMRLRIDTVKRLRALGEKKKAEKERRKAAEKKSYGTVTVHYNIGIEQAERQDAPSTKSAAIKTRVPRIKQAMLSKPPLPKARFRKRQAHKSWLPTHLFHTKRARMTEPSQPLWRFAIPLTPSQKSYRAVHRAINHQGAVMWDMSYVSTVSLQGKQLAILSMLRQLGVDKEMLDGPQDALWRDGKRTGQVWLFEREAPHAAIAPVTLIWNAHSDKEQPPNVHPGQEQHHTHLFLRVHPSAFHQVWEELVRLSKTVKPNVRLEDLRFEIGSIEVYGPGSTEALIGALSPIHDENRASAAPSQSSTFSSLNSLATPSVLPSHALLAFEIRDPRLNHPPRTLVTPPNAEEIILQLLASWPPDVQHGQESAIFSRRARLASQSSLPSQKSINRRKSFASPGKAPDPRDSDPRIPVLLYVSQSKSSIKSHTASWTILAPWKCISPIWYSLNHYPLSTGGQTRFGGVLEQRQIRFEAGEAWFPGDFPATKAGWDWELRERRMRWEEWSRRPKGKRTAWDKVNLGSGKIGEIGEGWACDWQRLLELQRTKQSELSRKEQSGIQKQDVVDTLLPPAPPTLQQLTPSQARTKTEFVSQSRPDSEYSGIFPVRINLLPRGTPKATARIYRLPSSTTNPALRAQWLALHPSNQPKVQKNYGLPPAAFSKRAPSHVVQRELARTLLRPAPKTGGENYPVCPREEDLIGFITIGGYNLGAGEGVGIANLLSSKVPNEVDSLERRLCIVRNAGESAGRLGVWQAV